MHHSIFSPYIFFFALYLFPCLATAQVKVGNNPTNIHNSALIEMESTNQGFLPPRMTEAQMNAISSPAEGLIVYCTDCDPKGLRLYDGTEWTSLVPSAPKTTVSMDCSINGFTGGDLVEGQALTTQTFSLTVTNNSFTDATLNFATSDLTLGGISGVSVSGVSPASVTLSGAGSSQLVTYTLSGNPTSFGTLTTNVDIAGILTCNTSVTVISASDAVLAQISNEADDPDNVNSVVTVAQLNTITPALTGVTAGNETAYQNYIDANPNAFSNPATQAEVQAMITAVNANQTLLANIGTDADNGNNALTSGVTAADFNALPGVSGAIVANQAAYLAYIAANANAFSAPATTGEVQAMITQVNANQTLLANIGTDADNSNNALTAGLTAADFNALPGVSGATVANEAAYLAYIAANANAFSAPATTGEVQAMITVVNTSQSVLVQIGDEANIVMLASTVTVAQLNTITPALTGVTAGNETAYQAYIDANPNAFSSPATQPEVQAMITAVNTSQSVLAQIGDEGDDPDVNPSVVTVAQLNTITPALTDVTADNETAYQAYIDANPADFSSPATQPEVQAMITAVNASQSVLAQIGNEGDNPDVVNSVVTVAQLNTILPALTGIVAANETAYQDYIDANPADFSSPATQAEVQAMVTAVNANPPIPATITLAQDVDHFVASIYDQDYLPYTAPTGAAVTTAVAADGTNEATTIDVQGSITTSGVTVAIPVTATGSGTLPAYSSTITIPASLTEDGISRDLTLSWASQAFTATTTSISATLTAVGGTLNVKKLDLNGGIGNDNLGVLLGSFAYPYNNAGATTTFEVRDISGIPDREFGDGVHDFIYLPVTNPATGETWLNNNLGASYANIHHPDFNPTQQATSSTDDKAYGSLYQWGRYSDGHELINRNAGDPHATSGTTGTNATTAIPNAGNSWDGLYILETNSPYDWITPQNNTLWQGASGTNNPCPTGYRVPTEAELNAERISWSSNNSAGALASPLKLSNTGGRDFNGGLYQVGQYGPYLSSTVSGIYCRYLRIDYSNSGFVTDRRSYGHPVRCIKD